jgi:hypothetical protein
MELDIVVPVVVSLSSFNVDIAGSTKQMGGNQKISAQKLQ